MLEALFSADFRAPSQRQDEGAYLLLKL